MRCENALRCFYSSDLTLFQCEKLKNCGCRNTKCVCEKMSGFEWWLTQKCCCLNRSPITIVYFSVLVRPCVCAIRYFFAACSCSAVACSLVFCRGIRWNLCVLAIIRMIVMKSAACSWLSHIYLGIVCAPPHFDQKMGSFLNGRLIGSTRRSGACVQLEAIHLGNMK